jgi:hypothetical protein
MGAACRPAPAHAAGPGHTSPDPRAGPLRRPRLDLPRSCTLLRDPGALRGDRTALTKGPPCATSPSTRVWLRRRPAPRRPAPGRARSRPRPRGRGARANPKRRESRRKFALGAGELGARLRQVLAARFEPELGDALEEDRRDLRHGERRALPRDQGFRYLRVPGTKPQVGERDNLHLPGRAERGQAGSRSERTLAAPEHPGTLAGEKGIHDSAGQLHAYISIRYSRTHAYLAFASRASQNVKPEGCSCGRHEHRGSPPIDDICSGAHVLGDPSFSRCS